MRQFFFVFLISILFLQLQDKQAQAQVLDAPLVFQEQNQWCWAAVAQSVLKYYGYQVAQCEIAEYTRSVATWHNFGNVNCCESASQGCNYWNYNWGRDGSIEDILMHFGNIKTTKRASHLIYQEAAYEMQKNAPFIMRWAWKSGGGHFVVGHGLSGDFMHYMDPWYNQGHMIGLYNWVVESTNHTWTHTQMPDVTETASQKIPLENPELFPNPFSDRLILSRADNIKQVLIFNLYGQQIMRKDIQGENPHIYTGDLPAGIYWVALLDLNGQTTTQKMIKH